MHRLDEQIARIVKSHGAELYDTEICKENNETIFRVYITSPKGVDIDLCADISRDLSPFFDVHPPMEGHYFLEVSSPGIERNLKKPDHFKSAVGLKIKLKPKGSKKMECLLLGADENGILVKTAQKEEKYGYDEIDTAKTIYDWTQ